MLVFVVDGDIEFRDDLAHGVDDIIVAFPLNVAVFGVDDLVASCASSQ